MVKRKNKQAEEDVKYRCRDCSNSYDWQSKAIDGRFLLCRCHYKKGGEFCVLLSDHQCENFNLREDGETAR